MIENNPLHKKLIENVPKNLLKSIGCQYYDETSFNNTTKNIKPALSLIHANLQSSTKNYGSLKAHLTNLETKFDIIAISESGVNNANLVQNTFENYQFYHRKPRHNTTKGGVALFINQDIITTISERTDLEMNIPYVENIWLQINNTIIAVIYKHPHASNEALTKKIEINLESINREKKMSIICGDININLLDTKSTDVKAYTDTLLAHNFIPTIALPTRITDHSLTLIDHINLYRPLKLMSSTCLSGNLFFDISDHLPNFIILEGEKTNAPQQRPYIRIYSERNIFKFQSLLSETNWNGVLSCNAVNDAYNEFTKLFSLAINQSFPLVKQSRRSFKDKKWITPAIKVSIRHKNRLYKKYLTKPNPANEIAYKHYKNKVLDVIEKAKITFYTDKLNSDKAKVQDIWKVYAELLGSKKNKREIKIAKLLHNGETLTDNSSIADAFNSFFATIGEKLAKNVDSLDASNHYLQYMKKLNLTMTSMYITPVSEEEVLKIIMSLDPHKAAGIDDFHVKSIKNSIPYTLKALTYVYNSSFSQSTVPDKLKISKVIPIYKKKEAFLPGNYRPISLLSMFDKILEKLMYARLYPFLTKNNLLYEYQFGFRSNHSTTLAVTEIVDNIREELDKNNHVLGLYLDLSKAFDCVNHNILLDKLSLYGIRGQVNDWFKSYLKDRSQITLANGTYSKMCPVNTGVPQGSVLGPILFLIYVNDIAQCVNSGKVRLFADDTNLFFSCKSIPTLEKNANESLLNLYKWFSSNKLTLNADKTCFTVFSNSKEKPNIKLTLKGTPIENVPVSKYLGMHLDDKLNWKTHINNIKNKLNQLTGAFYNLARYIDTSKISNIYHAYVFPHIKYGIELYGACDKTSLKSLQTSQNKILKVLYRKPRRYHTNQIHNELRILKCEDVYQLFTGIFVYKQQQKLLPNIFSNYFTQNRNIHRIRTRNCESLFLPRYKLKSTQKCMKYSGVKIWNSIPQEIRNQPKLHQFKSKFKSHMISEYSNQ